MSWFWRIVIGLVFLITALLIVGILNMLTHWASDDMCAGAYQPYQCVGVR